MKSKTDFKQMYLVDAAAYNGISRTETPIILGRSNNKVSPPTINVLAPVTSREENPNHVHTELKSNMKSIGTQNNVLTLSLMGFLTNRKLWGGADLPPLVIWLSEDIFNILF